MRSYQEQKIHQKISGKTNPKERSGKNYVGKPIEWKLTDCFGMEIPKEDLYVPHYRENCEHCGSRLICNGCSDCGRCKG